MIMIFNKKRILFISLVIVTSISSFAISNLDTITLETSSLPISNHTIILDAGHGLPDRWRCG